jgi:hypothetical protein
MRARTKAVISVDRLIFLVWGRLRETAPNSFLRTKSILEGPGTWTRQCEDIKTQGAFWHPSAIIVNVDKYPRLDWSNIFINELSERYSRVQEQLREC